MVTLNQFQHSKYLNIDTYSSLVATTLLIANAIITPAKRTRDRTVAIDINISIRGACKIYLLVILLAHDQLIDNWRVILVCNRYNCIRKTL